MNFELSKYPLQKSFQKEKEYKKKIFFWKFSEKHNVLTLRDISPVIFKHFLSLFWSCIFYFVAQIRKNVLPKEIKD